MLVPLILVYKMLFSESYAAGLMKSPVLKDIKVEKLEPPLVDR